MDVTLDDYIASNKELQEAIHCAKIQFGAMKHDSKERGVPKERNYENNEIDYDENIDDDAIEILAEDDPELSEIWQGPSSKQTYLSLNMDEDDEFDKLKNELEKVALEDKNESSNRTILGADILDNDPLPSVNSQQWRLRAPNIGSSHPPGMPPLVPVSLLEENNVKNNANNNRRSQNNFRNLYDNRLGQGSNKFKNNNRTFFNHRRNKNGRPFNTNYDQRRKSRYFQRNISNGNTNNYGNRAQYASTSSLQSNMPIINASTDHIVPAALNSSNIINFLPVGTVPFFINTNTPNNLGLNLNDFIDDGGINMNMNPLGYIAPVGLNVVAVSSNDGFLNNICVPNNETEFLLGRDNLNGVRNYRGIQNQQNGQFLRRALNMTVNSVLNNQEQNNNDVEMPVMNVDENSSLNLTSTQLVKALKDLFKDGIQIKLSL